MTFNEWFATYSLAEIGSMFYKDMQAAWNAALASQAAPVSEGYIEQLREDLLGKAAPSQEPVAWRWPIGGTKAYDYQSHDFAVLTHMPCGEPLYLHPSDAAAQIAEQRGDLEVQDELIKKQGKQIAELTGALFEQREQITNLQRLLDDEVKLSDKQSGFISELQAQIAALENRLHEQAEHIAKLEAERDEAWSEFKLLSERGGKTIAEKIEQITKLEAENARLNAIINEALFVIEQRIANR